MNDIAGIVLAAALLAVSAGAGAQQLYKCEGADGKTSYADKPCGPGKKDAGPIEDQINVAPAPKAKARHAAKPKATTHGATAKPTSAPPVAAAPERRCFNVKSSRKGGASSTRCNDDPAAPDPVPTDERSKAERKAE
jgi:hypothetical protein